MRPHLLNIVFSSAMGHCEFITMKIKICATNWMKTQFCLSIVEICGREEGCGAVLLITRRGRPRSQQSIAGFHPNSIRIQKLEVSLQFRSGGEKTKMKLSSALGFALLLAIVILLVVPEVS